jgi:hypothetical protein
MVMRVEHAEWEGLVSTLREVEAADSCVNRKYGGQTFYHLWKGESSIT